MKNWTSTEICDLYVELYRMMNYLFRDAARAYDPTMGFTARKRNLIYKRIIDNYSVNRDILICVMKFFGNGKLKYINFQCNDLNEQIIRYYKHSIIESICPSTNKNISPAVFHERFYRDNFIAFYIVLDKYLKFSSDKMPPGFFNFIKGMYFGFCDILYSYITEKFNLPEEAQRALPRSQFNPIRDDFKILSGMRSLLYSNTLSEDNVNVAVFIIRGYIESWIRNSFGLFYSGNGKYISISEILNAIKKSLDKSADIEMLKYTSSLIAINNWSNFYIHWKEKAIFWVPYFIEIYLNSLIIYLHNEFLNSTKIYYTSPPFTNKESELYSKVRSEFDIDM